MKTRNTTTTTTTTLVTEQQKQEPSWGDFVDEKEEEERIFSYATVSPRVDQKSDQKTTPKNKKKTRATTTTTTTKKLTTTTKNNTKNTADALNTIIPEFEYTHTQTKNALEDGPSSPSTSGYNIIRWSLPHADFYINERYLPKKSIGIGAYGCVCEAVDLFFNNSSRSSSRRIMTTTTTTKQQRKTSGDKKVVGYFSDEVRGEESVFGD